MAEGTLTDRNPSKLGPFSTLSPSDARQRQSLLGEDDIQFQFGGFTKTNYVPRGLMKVTLLYRGDLRINDHF